MSWLSAKKVLVPEAEAVTLGETDGAAAGEAGAAGDPPDPPEAARAVGVAVLLAGLEAVDAAVLAAELHAVTIQALPAIRTPAATCRALREFAIDINFPTPLTSLAAPRATTYTTSGLPPWLELSWSRAVTHGSFGMNITTVTGNGGQGTERTLVILRPAAIDAKPASAKSDG